jgi:hypothetical protein
MDQWKDMLSVLAMTKEYFVTEPYIPWKGDVRVQKIGNHYRAIERSRTTYGLNKTLVLRVIGLLLSHS